ncbi:hypothetical protein V5O48_007416 [Marasmius crinis-equi]|uniref:F-box domain-containing protein n=1 Tax=Marasmius crinis-equi TaxID=585013 RepID=A0ABR3FH14_9AGAR
MAFSLPLDLLSLILKFVMIGDAAPLSLKTIQACSLVSQTWCTFSRPHLFRFIQITLSKADTEKWLQRLKNATHLIPLIEHVTLIPWNAMRQVEWEGDVAEELGRRLSHVHSVTLAGPFMSNTMIRNLDPHLAFLKYLGAAKGGLHSLKLQVHVQFERPDQLFRYLYSTPGRPRHLSILSAGCYSHDAQNYLDTGIVASTTEGLKSAWPLESLVLYETEIRSGVLSWLLSPAVDLSDLRSFAIATSGFLNADDSNLDQNAIPMLEELLVSVGPSLRQLTLGTYQGNLNAFPVPFISHLQALKQLVLVSEDDYESGLSPHDGISYALQLLPHLHGQSSLEEIVLAVDIQANNRLSISHVVELADWEALDRALDASSIHSFRRLFVLVTVMFTDFERRCLDEAERIIRGAMPRLAGKGLLDVRAEFLTVHRTKALYHSWSLPNESV